MSASVVAGVHPAAVEVMTSDGPAAVEVMYWDIDRHHPHLLLNEEQRSSQSGQGVLAKELAHGLGAPELEQAMPPGEYALAKQALLRDCAPMRQECLVDA